MRSARSLLLLAISFLLLAIFISPRPASAQSTNTYPINPANSFVTPNIDPDVPRNQSTLAQTVTIEVMAAVMCQLSGINPIDSSIPCLGINPETRKIGYVKNGDSPEDGQKVGGLIGTATKMIAFTYQPIGTTEVYTRYLSDNFGIVKKAHAQVGGYGFEGLRPVFQLWISVRNIAYAMLVVAFAFIGVGIMLRVKIDPRTVMSIQNQIPKAIIAIILITFSYAIAALLIDLMWVSTYAGVNLIVNSSPEASKIPTGGGTLQDRSSRMLLEIPFTYVNNIFHTDKGISPAGFAGAQTKTPGIFHLTDDVSENIGSLLGDVVDNILGVQKNGKCLDVGFTKFDFSPANCVAGFISGIASFTAQLIIFVILIVALFKIWFNLLKAFIYTLFYVIISPIYIVFGMLPTKPLGFEKWMRSMFVNLAVFPITAFVIVAARVMMEAYDTAATQFIPPLIGHNLTTNFGSLLAFGAILMLPAVQKILQDKMGVKGVGTPGIIGAGMAAGAAVIGAPVGRAMKHLGRYDARSGDEGALHRFKRERGAQGISAIGHLPGLKDRSAKALARREAIHEGGAIYETQVRDAQGNVRTVNPVEEKRKQIEANRRQKGESRKEYRARKKERKKNGA